MTAANTQSTDPNPGAVPDDASSTSGLPHTAAASVASVTLAEVQHVATLASLDLSAEEAERMQHDLNAILVHVARLQQLDTTGVEPMAQVGQLLQVPVIPAGGDLRADAQRPSFPRAEIMHEAPETDGRFFKVPKVIER